MFRFISIILLALVVGVSPVARLFATDTAIVSSAQEIPAELLGRAARIVAGLQLADVEQQNRVTGIVASQYLKLRALDGEAATATGGALRDQRAVFIGELRAELDPAQIEQVKDGMTYGVVPNTWRVYQEMLPDLTAEQRRQVYAWLVEAREHAMDAGSAEEKHRWFGKYKGRINNYLAAAGVDMKAAERVYLARTKAAQKASATPSVTPADSSSSPISPTQP